MPIEMVKTWRAMGAIPRLLQQVSYEITTLRDYGKFVYRTF